MRKLPSHEIVHPQKRVHPVVVVLDDIRSAFNVGSVLRSADAAGIQHIYLTGFTAPGDHRAVHKSALGAQDTVAWSHGEQGETVVQRLRAEGFRIAAVEQTDAPTPVEALSRADFPLCLVLGNEVHGVSDEVLSLCDIAIEVTQFGEKHSLNVSVAFGIVAFDVIRRYRALDP